LTVRERKFLEIYFQGGKTLEESMILAGYTERQKGSLNGVARRIIQRYETQAGDHRIIARALGAGEVTILQGLLNLAQKGKSELVRLNAWSHLAKILGMTKEQIEQGGGITILFEAPSGPGPTLPAALALPAEGEQAPQSAPTYPGRVLQITR